MAVLMAAIKVESKVTLTVEKKVVLTAASMAKKMARRAAATRDAMSAVLMAGLMVEKKVALRAAVMVAL